jgi:retron-type reverse transcriptase
LKSCRNLWPELTGLDNLFLAARRARKGKRSKPACAAFEFRLESEVLALHRRLLDGSYSFGPYSEFEIREPKPRRIAAAPYPDRVLHHAIVQVLEPSTDPSFIHDSYACRVGKGTHAALESCKRWVRRRPYVLKLDVRHFYARIDHGILLETLARRFRDEQLLECLRRLLASFRSKPQEYAPCRGDDLFSPLQPRGIPIGNLTSQFFANLYLDRLDHFIQETLSRRGYLRYMDDMLLFGKTKAELHDARKRIELWLERERRLHVHPRKTRIFPVCDGVPFVGFRVFERHVRLDPGTGRRFVRRLRRLGRAYTAGEIEVERIGRAIAGWVGHARHGTTRGLVSQVLWDAVIPPRRVPAGTAGCARNQGGNDRG